jgi:hypothetical protein
MLVRLEKTKPRLIVEGLSASASNPDLEGEAKHTCEFPGYGRRFATTTGRAVHHQRAHKEWYDARLRPATDKVRWSAEEMVGNARQERGRANSRSQSTLHESRAARILPQRSVEDKRLPVLRTIKERRRRQDHKDMVTRFIEETANLHLQLNEREEEGISSDIFLDNLKSLPRLNNLGF